MVERHGSLLSSLLKRNTTASISCISIASLSREVGLRLTPDSQEARHDGRHRAGCRRSIPGADEDPRQRRDRTLIDTKEVALEFMHQPSLAFTMPYLPVLERAGSATAWPGAAADPLGRAAPQLEGGHRTVDAPGTGSLRHSSPPFRRQPPPIPGP